MMDVNTLIFAFVEGIQYNQTGREGISDGVEWLYDEFFQLVMARGIAYIWIGLESVGDFDLEWSKELSSW